MAKKIVADRERAGELLAEIDLAAVPAHVAVIMDGNGRWAKKQRLGRVKGHVAGAKVVRRLTNIASDIGVKVLTLYCFSTENWRRPEEEVGFLMKLIRNYLTEQANDMVKEGVRLNAIGDVDALPRDVREELFRVLELTKDGEKIVLNLALNYGGRDEILRAVRAVAADVVDGTLNVADIDEAAFGSRLFTAGLPDPDLLIRTSGEIRLSNFLPWQTVYTEFYFTDVNWPDFDDAAFYEAILTYQRRHRRFGGVEEPSPSR